MRFARLAPRRRPPQVGVQLVALASTTFGCAAVGGPPGIDAVIDSLSATIAAEIEQKEIPGLSIALVDDDRVLWSSGFGVADPNTGRAAAADTAYRVGSVSKLFTDIALMQLVEEGLVDLDAPITTYVPSFRPENPFGVDVTARMLLSHRAGLCREPPVGSYFDGTAPGLAATVDSLNETALLHRPGTRTKYSNAGIAVIGRVIEAVTGEDFAAAMGRRVLGPLRLDHSTFAPPGARSSAVAERLARGTMWGYDGRTFDAPTFPLGTSPAGELVSTVDDLGRFLVALFAGGAPVLSEPSLRAMLTPQEEGPYGLGFHVSELDGATVHGHNGAIYGFSTALLFDHERRLGVVVAANMDVSNAVTGRVARLALRHLVASSDHRAPPEALATTALPADVAARADGRYRSAEGDSIELRERDGRLFATLDNARAQVRARDDHWVVDDRHSYGRRITFDGDDAIQVDGRRYARQPEPVPAPCDPSLLGLLGEYGWDYNTLFVYERDGALHLCIEWIEIDPLTRLGDDAFAFPNSGMYPGEAVRFQRDASGRATLAMVAGVPFPRRDLAGEGTDVFRIELQRPIEELREVALRAVPPEEEGPFQPATLVDVLSVDPSIRLDIRYATSRNFMGVPFYPEPRAFLLKSAADALARVQRSLRAEGLGLLIHDGYRPWYVTKMFYDATPAAQRHFVADPALGSRHNRGCAVDLTLLDASTGEVVDMGGLYDEMTERSYPDYPVATHRQAWYRERLRRAMERQGFRVYPYEWWHFDFDGWPEYPINNLRFEEIDATNRRGP